MTRNEKHINLIFKYLTKEADNEETQNLFHWIEEDISNKKLYDSYQKTWQLADKQTNSGILNIFMY